MQWQFILIRYGEIFLKGKNRPFFKRKLKENIRRITSSGKIWEMQGRFMADYFPENGLLKRVFGLTSYSSAIRVEKDMGMIQQKALELLAGKSGTFKILPKRADKKFPLTSPEINVVLGQFIEQNTTLKFDGINPQLILGVEINLDGAYLFLDFTPCFGGLPTGVEGTALVLLENKNPNPPKERGIFNVSDTPPNNSELMQNNPATASSGVSETNEASLLAGLLLMKRGCSIIPVSVEGEKDITLLQKFSPGALKLGIFGSLSDIESFAREKGIDILVSGQSFNDFQKYPTSLTIFRPLIAYKKDSMAAELNGFRLA